MPFVMMQLANGKKFLLNLDNCMGFAESDDGKAIAVGTGGGTVPTGEDFEVVVADMTADDGEDPDETPAGPK